jgi:hypothetical protein
LKFFIVTDIGRMPTSVTVSPAFIAGHFTADHLMVDVNRWDEKAGLRRDAVGSQVIDVL